VSFSGLGDAPTWACIVPLVALALMVLIEVGAWWRRRRVTPEAEP